jgi:hypothetical protein
MKPRVYRVTRQTGFVEIYEAETIQFVDGMAILKGGGRMIAAFAPGAWRCVREEARDVA